jgi:hypothetical protein
MSAHNRSGSLVSREHARKPQIGYDRGAKDDGDRHDVDALNCGNDPGHFADFGTDGCVIQVRSGLTHRHGALSLSTQFTAVQRVASP